MWSRIVLFLAVAELCGAQLPADVEKRIQALPAEQRVYERFRYWISTQGADAQRSQDPWSAYREHLRSSGSTVAEIDEQIGILKRQGERLEIERWNRILTEEKPRFNTRPNAFLVDMVKGRPAGVALDVGMGQGRNAIWLAQQGWNVTGFDPAEKAVALARQNAEKLGLKLTTEVKSLEQFDFGESKWDLILLSYVGGREARERIQRALKPGGILVVEAFHRDATRGRAIGSGVVFAPGELVGLYLGLRVVRYEEPVVEADFGGAGEHVRVVRLCAAKPAN
jgi:SAM-dependent methyltransferase